MNRKTGLMLAAIGSLILISCTPRPNFGELFNARGVVGTLVISDITGEQEFIHNPERAKEIFLPASTFKIPNSLIALEAGAVSSIDEVIPWDGVKRFLPVWDQDQSMRTALPISCVWFYQELAKRVGNEQYLKRLESLNYGNTLTGPDVTRFWLDGDLRISAQGQVAFLKRLYTLDLDFDTDYMKDLHEMMFIESGPGYTLRAKTGWVMRTEEQIGWYVGWIETDTNTWVFALNIDITDDSQAAYRKEIVVEAFKQMGLIPS